MKGISYEPAYYERYDDTGNVANETAFQGVSHFFYMGHSKIKGENIYHRFASACHHAGHTAGIRIRANSPEHILKDYEGAAAGDRTEKDKRQELGRYIEEAQYRRKNCIYHI